MSDNKMVIMPNDVNTQMLEAVFEMFGVELSDENIGKYTHIYRRFVISSANQGEVIPDVVENVAKRISGIVGKGTKDDYIDDAILVIQKDLGLKISNN